MTYSSKGKKRVKDSNNRTKALDKYYTSPAVVRMVLEKLIAMLEAEGLDPAEYSYLEPCAGAAAFLDGLKDALPVADYQAFDIVPEDRRIKKTDFLKLKPRYSDQRIVIGNPPFGYKGGQAAAFINRCAEWAPVIAFVLPIQFRRYNMQKQIASDLKLIYSSDNLPKDAFTLEDRPYHVNSLFQIWVGEGSPLYEAHQDLRLTEPPPKKHEDFRLFIHNNTVRTLKYFDKDHYAWDFAVTRQGFYDYSERITDPAQLKPHVQYLFVKYINPRAREVFERLDFVNLARVNTSVLGFSNTDVVAAYTRLKAELGL